MVEGFTKSCQRDLRKSYQYFEAKIDNNHERLRMPNKRVHNKKDKTRHKGCG